MMGKNGKAVICVSTREATLKKHLRRHLKSLGFHKTDDGGFAPPGAGKDVIRTIHSVQRDDRLALNRRFISEHFSGLIKYFAAGKDVNVARISPVLQRISGDTWESDLFRLAALTWSVPVSNGFGRRLRYLVWDNHNNKLIGIIAIGDPVFNLSVRRARLGSVPMSPRCGSLADAGKAIGKSGDGGVDGVIKRRQAWARPSVHSSKALG
jgi:hypothetical protein